MFDISKELRSLPSAPGVYIMKDEKGSIIYIGKAKILKNRVKQYFSAKSSHDVKTAVMVKNIKSFEYIMTRNETEALILESNLIKKYKPRYNIMLKDDKSYPYIRVTSKDEFPRIEITRKFTDDGSKYFGSYTSMSAVKKAFELIREVFPVRTCKRKIEPKSNMRPCLNYYMGKCCGPCAGKISKEDYRNIVERLCAFLRGKYGKVVSEYRKKMFEYAKELQFERALEIKNRIEGIEHIFQKQQVFFTNLADRDVIGVAKTDTDACIQLFTVREGRLIGRFRFFMEGTILFNKAAVLGTFIKQYYQQQEDIPDEILVQYEPLDKEAILSWLIKIKGKKVSIEIPKRGEKKGLLDMAVLNASKELEKYTWKINFEKKRQQDNIAILKDILGLNVLPMCIEAYDISNLGATDIVGSMVVFTEGRPDKSKYRKFKIKNISIQNDYASIQEVLYRRLKRYKKQEEGTDKAFSSLPDLILADGGIAHVNAFIEVLNEFSLNIPVWGMAKDEKHRTCKLVSNNREYYLENNADLLRFISFIQNEAHRFAISYSKKMRKTRLYASALDEIEGVGPSRKRNLIKYFGSVKRIKEAEINEIAKVPGISKKLAEKIHKALNSNTAKS